MVSGALDRYAGTDYDAVVTDLSKGSLHGAPIIFFLSYGVGRCGVVQRSDFLLHTCLAKQSSDFSSQLVWANLWSSALGTCPPARQARALICLPNMHYNLYKCFHKTHMKFLLT